MSRFSVSFWLPWSKSKGCESCIFVYGKQPIYIIYYFILNLSYQPSCVYKFGATYYHYKFSEETHTVVICTCVYLIVYPIIPSYTIFTRLLFQYLGFYAIPWSYCNLLIEVLRKLLGCSIYVWSDGNCLIHLVYPSRLFLYSSWGVIVASGY